VAVIRRLRRHAAHVHRARGGLDRGLRHGANAVRPLGAVRGLPAPRARLFQLEFYCLRRRWRRRTGPAKAAAKPARPPTSPASSCAHCLSRVLSLTAVPAAFSGRCRCCCPTAASFLLRREPSVRPARSFLFFTRSSVLRCVFLRPPAPSVPSASPTPRRRPSPFRRAVPVFGCVRRVPSASSLSAPPPRHPPQLQLARSAHLRSSFSSSSSSSVIASL